MPDLCPQSIDLDMKLSAPSCPPTLSLFHRLQTEQTESQRNLPHPPSRPPGKVALVSVTTQTEIQNAQAEVQTTPVSVQPQTTLISIETLTIEVRETQTEKSRGEMQDEMEDRRQRVKEKQVSPIYPWDHMWLSSQRG